MLKADDQGCEVMGYHRLDSGVVPRNYEYYYESEEDAVGYTFLVDYYVFN